MFGHLLDGLAVHVLEDARVWELMLEPCAELKEGGYNGWIEHQG